MEPKLKSKFFVAYMTHDCYSSSLFPESEIGRVYASSLEQIKAYADQKLSARLDSQIGQEKVLSNSVLQYYPYKRIFDSIDPDDLVISRKLNGYKRVDEEKMVITYELEVGVKGSRLFNQQTVVDWVFSKREIEIHFDESEFLFL